MNGLDGLVKSFENLGDLRSDKERLDEQKQWLDRLPKCVSTILDVGCGPGLHSKYFLDKGMIPTALDPIDVFKFHEDIEFLNLSLFDIPRNRKFDAVFCSHVLEHCPDPFAAVLRMREAIVDGGYLIIIVPPYNHLVTNDHWITGWNISQLAMFLVAAGFDCRDGIFTQFGINVCGFGRKSEFARTGFNLKKSLPYLPMPMANGYFLRGDDEFLEGRLAFADKHESWKLGIEFASPFPSFDYESHIVLEYSERSWKSVDRLVGADMDLSKGEISTIVFVEGKPSALRLALGNGTEHNPFQNCAELWINVEPGIGVIAHSVHDFRTVRGQPNYKEINQVSLGGWCEHQRVCAWVLGPNGEPILGSPGGQQTRDSRTHINGRSA